MRLLISTVLLHFDLELCAESKGWSDQKVYTLWEKHPLMCMLKEVVKPKSDASAATGASTDSESVNAAVTVQA